MIHSFKIFESNLQILESLGDGTETFTEKLEMYGKLSNLDLYGCPTEWGEEIEEATGEIIYSVTIEADKSGIESINFQIEKIVLNLSIISGYDENKNPILKDLEYEVTKSDIKTKVEMTIFKLPFYIEKLSIDFSQAENIDGDFLPEKVKFELEIGKKD